MIQGKEVICLLLALGKNQGEPCWYLRPNRVLNANHSDAGKVRQDLIFRIPVRLNSSREIPIGQANGTQPLTSHWLNHFLHHLIPVLHLKYSGFPILVQDLCASESKVGWGETEGIISMCSKSCIHASKGKEL